MGSHFPIPMSQRLITQKDKVLIDLLTYFREKGHLHPIQEQQPELHVDIPGQQSIQAALRNHLVSFNSNYLIV